MKLAVTGSNGRVGRHVVVAALEAGHIVVGIDTQPVAVEIAQGTAAVFEFRTADLRSYEAALGALEGAEAVVHLAAVPTPGDYVADTHNTNVVISWNVLRAAAELGITRIAQASSVNVVALVWSVKPKIYYLPLDEEHPCEPDEPYGLSKLICEMQAETIVRRYPSIRIASLRPSWCTEDIAWKGGNEVDSERRKNDLWGYVGLKAVAQAFLRAVDLEDQTWLGHEAFFVTAPDTTLGDAKELWELHWREVPIKEGKNLERGFFDCSKAERLLGWTHDAHKLRL